MDPGYTPDRGVSGSQTQPARLFRRVLVNDGVQKVNGTFVNIHEYQAKQMLKAYDISVPAGRVCFAVADAV